MSRAGLMRAWQVQAAAVTEGVALDDPRKLVMIS